MVSLLQIEDLIEQYPGWEEAAVIGIPDEKWGEWPMALVVTVADHAARIHEADIKEHLQTFAARGVISKFGIPESIRFVDHLPKTSVGKIGKKALRETYGQAAARWQPPA